MPGSPSHTGSLTTPDGLRLHTQEWHPPAPPKALVVLVHGYAEHCGRYGHVARTLTRRGSVVYGYDQRGYGQSDGRRAYVDTFEAYLDDLQLVLDRARSEHSGLPLFLFGHSMGGLVVLKYVLDRAPSLRGLILSSPAIEINPDLAPVLRRVAQVLGWLFPTLPTTRSSQGALSRDPEVVEAARNDPLNYHGRVRARTGAEMLRAGQEVQERLDDLQRPFLVFHGTADSLTSPDWSQQLYDQAPAADKTIHLYDGFYHETFNEPGGDRVLQDLGNWLAERLP